MFTTFFYELRKAQVPVSLKEYLALMEAMRQGIADYSVEDFYYLSRACLVKDERNLDRFDRVFGTVFKGLAALPDDRVTLVHGAPGGSTRSVDGPSVERGLVGRSLGDVLACGGSLVTRPHFNLRPRVPHL